jgi:hypothetical protein
VAAPPTLQPETVKPERSKEEQNKPAQNGQEQSKPERIKPEQIKTVFLRLVSEKTGYPEEMLDLKANLEAGLGIDSIKRVEILGAFNRETGLLNAADIEQVSALKTLGAMIDFFRNGSPVT